MRCAGQEKYLDGITAVQTACIMYQDKPIGYSWGKDGGVRKQSEKTRGRSRNSQQYSD
jgi:hypothetical protein